MAESMCCETAGWRAMPVGACEVSTMCGELTILTPWGGAIAWGCTCIMLCAGEECGCICCCWGCSRSSVCSPCA